MLEGMDTLKRYTRLATAFAWRMIRTYWRQALRYTLLALYWLYVGWWFVPLRGLARAQRAHTQARIAAGKPSLGEALSDMPGLGVAKTGRVGLWILFPPAGLAASVLHSGKQKRKAQRRQTRAIQHGNRLQAQQMQLMQQQAATQQAQMEQLHAQLAAQNAQAAAQEPSASGMLLDTPPPLN